MCTILPLHPAGAIAAYEPGHIGNTNTVEVSEDRMLQAACRHGELQRGLPVGIVVQTIEQPTGKAVAAADPVYNVPYLIFSGSVEVPAIVQAGCPAIPVGAVALPQRDGDHFHVRIYREHLIAKGLVLCTIQIAGLDVHIVHRDLERLLHVLFVSDCNVHVRCNLAHDLAGPFAILPEVLAIARRTHKHGPR